MAKVLRHLTDATTEERAAIEELVAEWSVEWLTATRPPNYVINDVCSARLEVRERLNKGCKALGFHPYAIFHQMVEPVLQEILHAETGYTGLNEYYQRSFGLYTVAK